MMPDCEGQAKPNLIPGIIIAHNPMDLVCIDFNKMDPLKDCKENILVLTDAFTKFSQAFVTPNQKVITIAKKTGRSMVLCVWYSCIIHSNKGCSFDN